MYIITRTTTTTTTTTTEIELSLGGSSLYISTDKTNKLVIKINETIQKTQYRQVHILPKRPHIAKSTHTHTHTPSHYKIHTHTHTHYKTHTYTQPHIHTHTHTLQKPHINTPTHYKTHTQTQTHTHTNTHYKTHTYTMGPGTQIPQNHIWRSFSPSNDLWSSSMGRSRKKTKTTPEDAELPKTD